MVELLDKGPSGFGAWLRSALSSAGPELIGIEPSIDLQLYRQNNPVGGITSSLAGFAIPGAGAAAAVSRIPKFAKVLQTVGNAERMAAAPFVTRAQVEALRFAPFEVGRTLGSAIAGDNTWEVAKEGVFNIAAAAGIGGVLGMRAAAVRPPAQGPTDIGKLAEVLPKWDAGAPPQMRLPELRAATVAQPDKAELFGRAITKAINETFDQVPDSGKNFVLSIAGDKEATKTVRRLFTAGANPQSTLRANKLTVAGDGFSTVPEQDAFFLRAGIGDKVEFASSILYPRRLVANSEKAAGNMRRVLDGGMWGKADDWWYTREDGGNGMLVMAKRTRGQGDFKKGDEWLVFKTNKPRTFLPEFEQSADGFGAFRQRMWPGIDDTAMDQLGAQSALYKDLQTMENVMGPQVATDAFANLPKGEANGLIAKWAKALSGTVFGRKAGSVVHDDVGRLGQILREHVVPAEFQFANPRAKSLYVLAKNMRDNAVRMAHEAFFGDTSKLSTAFKYVRNYGHNGLIDKTIDELAKDKKLFDEAVGYIVRMIPSNEAAELGASPQVLKLLKQLDEADGPLTREILISEELVGKDSFRLLPEHRLVARTWRGEHRAEIVDELDRRLMIHGGRTPAEAKKIAEAFVEEMKQRGVTVKVGKEWTRGDRTEDLAQASRIVRDKRIARAVDESNEAILQKALAPKSHKERKELKGFLGDWTPMTPKELKEIVSGHLEGGYRYAAENMFQARMTGQMSQLAAENPNMGAVLAERLDQVWGKKGPLDIAQNAVADKFLSSVLGGNSATKIANAVNTGMTHLTFGFMNIQFPALNAITTVLTAPAEIAFLQSARPEKILKYYSMIPVLGADGMPRAATGMIDNLRLQREAFRQLKGKDADFMSAVHRAAGEGHIAPRYAEEVIGENSKIAGNFRDALASPGGFGKWVANANMWLPTMSEKFARVYSFSIGYTTAKDVFGLKDPERIYQFAKRFGQRTMYEYSKSDRAKVFTGPIGSVAGLYKNWMMHYLGNWMMYAGEGVMANNFKPLLWATASAWTTGGALGSGPASILVDGAARVLSDKPTTEALYDWFGGNGVAADAAMYGLPGLFGMSLVSMGQAPGSETLRDIGFFFNMAIWDRAKAAGKLAGNAVDSLVATGQNPVNSPLITENFMRAFAPRTIYKAMSALEDANVRSLSSGTPLLRDLGLMSRVMYTFGLNPVEVDKTFALGREIWAENEKLKSQVAWLGRRWMEAQRYQDWGEMNRVMGMGIGLGIFDKVMRSVMTRQTREEQDFVDARRRGPEVQARRANLGI